MANGYHLTSHFQSPITRIDQTNPKKHCINLRQHLKTFITTTCIPQLLQIGSVLPSVDDDVLENLINEYAIVKSTHVPTLLDLTDICRIAETTSKLVFTRLFMNFLKETEVGLHYRLDTLFVDLSRSQELFIHEIEGMIKYETGM